MKKIFILSFLLAGISIFAQNDCEVKVENLFGTYEGDCKDGLAEGKGLAIGKDTYKGKFKKGYPEGRGTYTYENGSVFKGKFIKGRREGKGRYEFYVEGKKMTQDGYWEDDTYVGPKKIQPYEVKIKRNIDRYNIRRTGDGNDVKIYLKQNGRNNPTVTDVMINGSSGNEMSIASNMGYKNVEFPFNCNLRYTTNNKLQTGTHEVLFEFEILKPGSWAVTLHN